MGPLMVAMAEKKANMIQQTAAFQRELYEAKMEQAMQLAQQKHERHERKKEEAKAKKKGYWKLVPMAVASIVTGGAAAAAGAGFMATMGYAALGAGAGAGIGQAVFGDGDGGRKGFQSFGNTMLDINRLQNTQKPNTQPGGVRVPVGNNFQQYMQTGMTPMR